MKLFDLLVEGQEFDERHVRDKRRKKKREREETKERARVREREERERERERESESQVRMSWPQLRERVKAWPATSALVL